MAKFGIFIYDSVDRLTKVQENNQDIMSMVYSANGNITSKTGVGSYTYNSSSRPHAVTAVDNTDDVIDYYDQDIDYNAWGKVSSVWKTDASNFHYYFLWYGPDLKRVWSQMDKTYQRQYDMFYWDDYEEKFVGTDTLRFYYIYGADGLAGLHIVKTGQNIQTTSHTTAVITDHLGSITSLIDNDDWVYDVSYDVWGNRDVKLAYWLDPTFERGYTGHDNLDVLDCLRFALP